MTDSATLLADPPASSSRRLASPSRPVVPVRSRTRTWLIWTIIVLLFAASLTGLFLLGEMPRRQRAAVLADAVQRNAAARPRVRVATPRPAPASQTLRLPGTVEPARATGVFGRVGGYVAERLVEIGDRVEAGQVLVRIDAPDIVQQLARNETLLELARTGVEQAAIALRRARIDHERSAQLGAQMVSQQNIDHLRADQEAADANLKAATVRVKEAETEVRRLRQLVSFTEVTAPFAGVITSRTVEVGNLIPAGGGVTPLFHLVQVEPLRVVIEVPQASLTGVAPGLAVTVSSGPVAPTVTGAVERVAQALDAERRAMRVEIGFPVSAQAARWLAPGMRIQATLAISQARPLLLIGADAVLLSAQGTRVAVLDRDDRVHLVPVTVIADSGTEVLVADGLTPTDRVVANPGGTLAEGTAVEIAAPAAVDHVPTTPGANAGVHTPDTVPASRPLKP